MKERPIIFDAESMRGILDGSKTQTRRLAGLWEINKEPEAVHIQLSARCPFGAPGDRLWTKEAWRTWAANDGDSASQIAEKCLDAGYSKPWAWIEFKDGKSLWANTGLENHPGRWRQAIHQPRWASRATLEIVSVRPEQLQAISEGDAIAEGLRPLHHRELDYVERSAKTLFSERWDRINGKRKKDKPDVSWASNCWVWRLEFKVVK